MTPVAIRRAAALSLVIAAVGAIAAASRAAPAELSVTADPALSPAFDPAVHDYVSRCGETNGIQLSVSAPPGVEVSVDGQPAKSGSFTAGVSMGDGEATTIVAHSGSGDADYHVRCLPDGFPRWTATLNGTPQARWYLVGPIGHYTMLFDPAGAPVWWLKERDQPFNPTLLSNGHVAAYPLGKDQRFGKQLDKAYVERRLDGQVVSRHRTVGTPTDLHEFQELPNGHLLMESFRPRHGVNLTKYGGPKSALVYYPEVQELTRRGKLLWRWNARGHISLDETDRWQSLVETQSKFPPKDRWYDAYHINSMSPDHHGGLVISNRHDDAIYRFSKASGRVTWKIGGIHTKKSLKVIGDPDHHGRKTFGGQHDARVLPDGTVTVYDNGAERKRPPRVVRYRIDLEQRTATLLEDLEDPTVPKSGWGGGTRKLPGGNWATAWGGTPFVSEMTPAGKRVFGVEFGQPSNYRAQPVLPGVLKPEALRAAMDRMHPRK